MKSISFRGCGTALITPFRDGNVDYDAFVALLKRQTDAGIHFLVPLGTTGETPCLDEQERIKLLELTREHCGGRKVIAGGGTNSLAQTVRSIKLLEPHGADAFLIVVPYYNKPTQQGMYEYFKAVADSTDKPLVLYNVPGRTGANLLAETTLRLAEIENIVAVKEASGNYAQISEIIRNAPEGFSVLSGNDDETLPLMATGAAGIISVASNVAPRLMVELAEALMRDDMDTARRLHHRLTPLFRNCFVESNPIPAKAALAAMGLISNELRLPLVPASEKTYALMRKTVAELGL
ncbi:MAG: 4-hydroxy-tetrahydrodipicolinate synthase [Bacteroidetes bacterium]|uniref:4-hydroxy-tetrahydrodipicolinate synthase n=1 Tax=Candidatus Cryptobacteroides excrementipullorum TaxID=2840761 RepID=A0A9D9ISD0_9BACT|nr:4-hydroxy-tetrahydrodipicolinate synthase [Candidatus Cryptobacteroides excrementipullorum]